MLRNSLFLCAVLLAGNSVCHAGVPDEIVDVLFTEMEQQIIREYYRDHRPVWHGNSKGKKHKGLPPGIAKNLERGKPLPPGIAKQALPYDLERELPPVPTEHERIIIAGKIILVEVATNIIHDVLTDALFH